LPLDDRNQISQEWDLINIMRRFPNPQRKDSKNPPVPSKLIHLPFLAVFDDMFYRLSFDSTSQLESLIKKDRNHESQMAEIVQTIPDLNNPRVVQDFADGWKKYLRERQPTKSRERLCAIKIAFPRRGLLGRIWRRRRQQQQQQQHI
jgi:hypothetical protein